MKLSNGIFQLVLFAVPCLVSAEVLRIKVPLTGQLIATELSSNSREIEFYGVSPGNVTSTMTVEVGGPAGTKAVVHAKVVKGDVAKSLAQQSGWFPISIKTIASKNFTPATTIPTSSDSCSGVPMASVHQLVQIYAMYGLHYTASQICALIGGSKKEQDIGVSYPSKSVLNLGQAGSIGFLQKDACAPKKTKTLIRVKIDLSKVPAEQLSANPILRVGIREYEFTGNKAATIKPLSDGKFAPKPLILMSALGGLGGGGEVVQVVRWKGNKPSKPMNVRVEDYVYYRGLVLTRSVGSKALSGGGKATFNLTNGQRIYGVCFNRSRTRQRVFGYPG